MSGAAFDPDCMFCRIAHSELPASVVYEDDATLAFMDIRPARPGHTLVIPRPHAPLLRDLGDDARAKLWASVMRVYDALRASDIPMDAVNLIVADGTAAGQEVPHAHVHLIPRQSGDGFGFRRPPGSWLIAERDDLDTMAARIRSGAH
ncbi:MAG TPA: HIT domain-containing protein [Candidatus Dormibacteraeota bacterium]